MMSFYENEIAGSVNGVMSGLDQIKLDYVGV